MKSSHYTTPRTIEDCEFAMNADPIERFERQSFDWQDKLVLIGCAFAAISVALILFAE